MSPASAAMERREASAPRDGACPPKRMWVCAHCAGLCARGGWLVGRASRRSIPSDFPRGGPVGACPREGGGLPSRRRGPVQTSGATRREKENPCPQQKPAHRTHIPSSVILRCEAEGRASKDARPLRCHGPFLRGALGRHSFAPQDDGWARCMEPGKRRTKCHPQEQPSPARADDCHARRAWRKNAPLSHVNRRSTPPV